MLQKHWKYRSLLPLEAGESVKDALLERRGVRGQEEVDAFLHPQRSQSHDPFKMYGMERASARLERGIEQNEHIRLYGDYDVDGVCSVALLYRLLRPYVSVLSYYQPDRYQEGYGLSLKGVRDAAKAGVLLLIVLDCGTSDLKAAAEAKALGVDLIVCDHHVPGEELPECVALLNPKQKACNYPEKELSACAIGGKLWQGMLQRGLGTEEIFWENSELLALSLVADQIPLVGEARALLHEGLRQMGTAPSLGLAALMEQRGVDPTQVVTNTINYQLAPPINAAGRIAHAKMAVELLIAQDETVATERAANLLTLNKKRQDIQAKVMKEALKQLHRLPAEAPCTVLVGEEWHPGVIGIVASRCMEEVPRPTLIFSCSEGVLVGSMRSLDPVHAQGALEHCAQRLLRFGGHRYAAGCSLLATQLAPFEQDLKRYVQEKSQGQALCPSILVDLPLDPRAADRALYEDLQKLAPYGKGNPSPLFCANHIRAIKGSVKELRGGHLRLRVLGHRGALECIGFGFGSLAKVLDTGIPFHMVYELGYHHFSEKGRLQLNVQALSCD